MPRHPTPTAGFVKEPSLFLLIAGVLLVQFAACRPAEVVTHIPVDEARLKGVVTIYAYAAVDLGRPPRSVEELLPIFQKASVNNPEEAMTSTRDGQAFVIVWGWISPVVTPARRHRLLTNAKDLTEFGCS